MKTTGLGEPGQVLELLESHIEEDNEGRHYTMRIRISASFESMSIGTQFSDSSNEGNIFPPYTMSYGVMVSFLHILQVLLVKNMEWLTILMIYKCHSKFHIKWKKDFKRACG